MQTVLNIHLVLEWTMLSAKLLTYHIQKWNIFLNTLYLICLNHYIFLHMCVHIITFVHICVGMIRKENKYKSIKQLFIAIISSEYSCLCSRCSFSVLLGWANAIKVLMLLKSQINTNTYKNGFLLPTKCLDNSIS